MCSAGTGLRASLPTVRATAMRRASDRSGPRAPSGSDGRGRGRRIGSAVTWSSWGRDAMARMATATRPMSSHGVHASSAAQIGADSLTVAASATTRMAGMCQPCDQSAAAVMNSDMAGRSTPTGRTMSCPHTPGSASRNTTAANARTGPKSTARTDIDAADSTQDIAQTNCHMLRSVPQTHGRNHRRWNGRATCWPSPASM